jgi:hypothetical protein
MTYAKNNKQISPYHIKHILETPLRIAYYSPNNLQSRNTQLAAKLVIVSKHLWKYYHQLDTHLDTGTHDNFTEPDSLLNTEKEMLEEITELPEDYRNELLNQHIQFKNIFIKRSLRERGVPGQLSEITLLNLPLLGVFFGSKGDLLAVPTLIALKHSGLQQKTISHCSRYMRYFVRARAIVDDIKDWRSDLIHGHLTCVHVQCIKSLSRTQHDRTIHLCLNLKNDQEIIKKAMHQKVIPRLIDEIVQTHREYIKEIDNDTSSSKDRDSIRAILEPAFYYLENLTEKYRSYYTEQLPTAINIDASTKVCYSM